MQGIDYPSITTDGFFAPGVLNPEPLHLLTINNSEHSLRMDPLQAGGLRRAGVKPVKPVKLVKLVKLVK
tara:strand:- start:7713 stop:7919 length:207 start_codon:yes stop_codon:yes gene_type:complete